MNPKQLLFLAGTVIVLLLANFFLGSRAIQAEQTHDSFACNAHEDPICLKQFGFESVHLSLSIFLLNFIAGLFSLHSKSVVKNSLFTGVGWIVVVQLIVSIAKIPVLWFSLDQTSLSYDAFVLQWPVILVITLPLLGANIGSAYLGHALRFLSTDKKYFFKIVGTVVAVSLIVIVLVYLMLVRGITSPRPVVINSEPPANLGIPGENLLEMK